MCLPMAGGLFLFPKKLVRKRDWMRVDLPSPDSPKHTKTKGNIIIIAYTPIIIIKISKIHVQLIII